MGVSYYSYLVIGCEIDEEKFKIPKKVRACECPVEGVADLKFCPDCGKEVWEEDYDFIDGYKEQESFLGLPLVHNTDYEDCWIAIHKEEVDCDSGEAVMLDSDIDLKALKEELKKKIEPFGLWDEESFGIWVITYCSY